MCRGGKAIQLSIEHSTGQARERERIKAAGGDLQQVAGVWRIGQAGLQVTRSDFNTVHKSLHLWIYCRG